MSDIKKKRRPAVIARPVLHDGVRYVVVRQREGGRFEKPGSTVAAYADDSEDLLWAVNVYDYPMPADMERDKRTVWISEMALDDAGEALLIGDERGGKYRLDLSSHEVTART